MQNPDFDPIKRLEELSSFEDGWLYGNGKAMRPDHLKWAKDFFANTFPKYNIDYPTLSLSEENGLSIYFTTKDNSKNVIIDLDFITYTGECIFIVYNKDHKTEEDVEFFEVDFNNENEVDGLFYKIKQFIPDGCYITSLDK